MIEVAGYSGFCFGVSRAVSEVDKLIESGTAGRIYTLGDIIHNPTVVERFEKAGVRSVTAEELPALCDSASPGSNVTFVIRTHGVEKQYTDYLKRRSEEDPDVSVIDCTCPFVAKIHDIAKQNSKEGTVTLIFGDEDHPEVRGIKSCVSGKAYCFSSFDQLKYDVVPLLLPEDEIILVSQTTQNLTEWKKCQNFIENLYTNAKIFDTICSVTEKRQNETLKLAERVDVMLVIGGKNSSNTNKLYSVAAGVCPKTFLIEKADECRKIPVGKNIKVGITAGASTPDSIIEEVKTIMSEEIKDTMEQRPNEAEESFEKLLDETFKTLNTGDVVTGTITQISNTEIKVDLGTKVTGILSYDDVTDEPGVKLDELFKVGDQVTAYAVRVSDVDGVATLSKRKYDAKNNWQQILDAYQSGEYLEGKFVEVVRGGAICTIKGVRAFVPASHTTIEEDGDMNSLIGKKMPFKIIDVDTGRRRVKASARIPARAAARAERKAAEAKFWEEIEEGKEYEGIVRSIQSYGAFVELGSGVDGMVHTTELSWKHIGNPSEVVSIGDKIKVFVKSFDREKKRISLGYKTEATNPWTLFTNAYQEGDIVNVKIVNIMPFGAFAEILPGADGLIHISQLSNKRVAKPDDVVKVGDTVDVKITAIDYDRKQISLSIRALLAEEEPEEAPAEEEPAEETAEEAPVEEAPAEEAPAEEAPAEEEKPAEEAPAEETPAE
ncbi:MAG: bifunctional 4-hydroxy-3-methylbut-2-enyl diphosphate reductase/30S ribosomal protein S1 [Clostridia bacterium]|nr:bifunctional 4-hydroxy-3-methylbut-2-enyl diphosphate reductase/30S ribosomal protein S1 [Clostridia bacterium]